MRQALARLDPGAALAIFRIAAGLSQQALADILGWSQSQVSNIERAKRDTLFDLRELLHFADMVEMPRAALAPLLAGEPNASFEDDGLGELGGGEEDVDRRGFGGFAAGAAAAVMLPEITVPPRVTAAHVSYLRSCADSLSRRDQAVGGGAILKQALRLWQRARRMLDESDYSEAVGSDLLGAAGGLAVCVGWVAFDAGNLVLARRMYLEALPLAGSTNDPVLSVHVLHNLSMLSTYVAQTRGNRGLARDALRFADQAAHAARSQSMRRLHALIALRRAGAASVLGDATTFAQAIGCARDELERGISADDPQWIHFVDESEILTHEARGHENLGNLATASELHRQSLDQGDLSPRNRACGQAQLAAALADSGDISAAVDQAMEVLPELSCSIRSVRTLGYLHRVRVAASTTKAAEFCSRFDAVERTLTA